MTNEELKDKIVQAIYDDVRAGWRTTETGQLYRYIVTGRRHAKDDNDKEWYSCHDPAGLMKTAILELLAEKRIKCVTEDRPHPDYCWLVPPGWNNPVRLNFIPIPKKDCEVFDLYG